MPLLLLESEIKTPFLWKNLASLLSLWWRTFHAVLLCHLSLWMWMPLIKEQLEFWSRLRRISPSRRPVLLESYPLSSPPISLWSCSNPMPRPCSLGPWPPSPRVQHIRPPKTLSHQATSSPQVGGQESRTVRDHAGWSSLTAPSRLWMRSWETCCTRSMLPPSLQVRHLIPRPPAQREWSPRQSRTARALREDLQRRRGTHW